MYTFELSLILIVGIFAQICITEEKSPGQLCTAKTDLKEYVHYSNRQFLSPQCIQNLDNYIYKDLNINQVEDITLSPKKQGILANILVDTEENLTTVTSETIAVLINNSNKVIIKYKPYLSKINDSYMKLIKGTTQNPNFLRLLNTNQQNYPKLQPLYQKTDDDIYSNFINRQIEMNAYSKLNLSPKSNVLEYFLPEFHYWDVPGTNKVNSYNTPYTGENFKSGVNNFHGNPNLDLHPTSSIDIFLLKPFYRQWKPFGYVNSTPSTIWKRKRINKRASEKGTETIIPASSAKDSVSKNIAGINTVNKILESVGKNGHALSSVDTFQVPKNIVKSFLGVLMRSFQDRDDDTDNHIKEEQRYITVSKPTVKTDDIEEEDRPGIKIIGGSAATSSGVPLSVKGRINFNKN